MDTRQTGSLNEADAEALLLALSAPLKWQYAEEEEEEEEEPINSQSETALLQTVRWSSQNSFYNFEVYGTISGNQVWLSENGEEMPWLLSIEKKAKRQSVVQRDGWMFPCRTAQEGKLLCEQFVWTENSAELDRLEVCRNPLHWGNYRFNSEIASLRRNMKYLAQYVVAPRTQWSIRHYRVYCEVDLHKNIHKQHLAAFLRLFTLPPPSTSPHNYATVDEAKAACEHHLATGQWPKGTLPRFLDKKQ